MTQPNSISKLHVNCHRIHWAEYGNADAPALLLIHGASGNVLPMNKMTALDDKNFRIIEMHQRGVGLSLPQGETDSNTVQDNIDDIERLREHLSVKEWSILSWSYGATLMAGYAFAHPEACNALISYAPFLGSQEDYDVLAVKKPEVAAVYFAAQGTSDARQIARNFYENARSTSQDVRLNSYIDAQRVWNPALDSKKVLAEKSPEEWRNILNGRAVSAGHYRELYNEKNRFLEKCAHESGALTIPTVLIYGDNDGWSEFNGYAAQIFGNRKVVHAPDAGHGIDHPQVQRVLKRELALL